MDTQVNAPDNNAHKDTDKVVFRHKSGKTHGAMTTNPNGCPAIDRAIHDAIRTEIERVTKEEIDRAQQEIERKVRARTGEIVTTIFRKLEFERFGQHLRITVDFPWNGDKP